MHEFSLIASLLNKIEAIAREQQATKVTGVRVRLGALAHISADHLREHFEQGARGTIAEGARLDIIEKRDLTEPHAQEILLESVVVKT
jgi:hydrogenase nickel incorporation protein HypA/HybF